MNANHNGRTGQKMLGYNQALKITLDTVWALTRNRNSAQGLQISQSMNRVLYEDVRSIVDSPSIHASTKDGFAVRSEDIASATPENPVELKLIDRSAAGGPAQKSITNGTTIRVLTGAKVPEGANAVLAEEFTNTKDDTVIVFGTAETGRNILPQGEDVQIDEIIAKKGTRITPGLIGLLAASGMGEVLVFSKPKVAILATGDELVVPGEPLPGGHLYASNLEMLKAWCIKYDMPTTCCILKDRPQKIKDKMDELIDSHDVLLTSGGAWTGDRDFVAEAFETLGWEKKFHTIRMGPGKPVGFGILREKPVFILPGGPPSNLTAFLQVALPGIMTLEGDKNPGLQNASATLTQRVASRKADWTQFIYGRLTVEKHQVFFNPLLLKSRLKSIALANGVIAVPEGVNSFESGASVNVQLLS